MGYAFISYSTRNQQAADAMHELLKSEGIDTWMAPGDIPAGSKYAKVINRAVKDCACFILMLSADAQNSPWVPKEVERAVNYRKPIIPVQIEDVVLNDDFELYISTDQIIAIQKIDKGTKEILKLLSSVNTYTNEYKEDNSQNLLASQPNKTKKKAIKTILISLLLIIFILGIVFWGYSRKSGKNAVWNTQYQEYLQVLLDKGTLITGAWIYDVDGDGIPMVALSTSQAAHRIPNIIINFKNNHFVVKNDIVTAGTGNAVKQEAFFCLGTDSFAISLQGMTSGTWTQAELDIYDLSSNEYVYSLENHMDLYTYDLEETAKATVMHDEISLYTKTVTERLESELKEYFGQEKTLINYNDNLTVFDITFDGNQSRDYYIQMNAPVAFLEKNLGISLSLNKENYEAK